MKRTILITGATSGIGAACAEKFAAGGDRLIINGRRAARLSALEQRLRETYRSEVCSLPFDVRDRTAVFQAIDGLPNDFKAIDVLVNSAGLALGRDFFEEAPLEDWENMLDTNVRGLLYVTRAVLPGMIAAKKGLIINLGSVAGDTVYEKGNVYCASKSAVEAISRAMRIDLLRHGIRVTNVKPGAVETEFSLVRFKGNAQQAGSVYEGFQPLTGEEVAGVIYYCASLPPHVCINDIEVTPVAQANGIFFYKQPRS